MTHFDTLSATLGPTVARDVLSDLKAAGFIIVRRDAIAQAQREAVAQYKEDSKDKHWLTRAFEQNTKRAA